MIFFKKTEPIGKRVFENEYELPLSAYLDVLFSGIMQAIVKPGKKATDKECSEVFQKIMESYIAGIDTKESKHALNLDMRIELLRLKVNKITTCALALRTIRKLMDLGRNVDPYSQVLKMIREESGYNGVFNVLNPEQFEKDIVNAENAANRYIMEIDNKRAELSVLTGGKQGEPATRETYITTLARMSRWAKVRYTPETITLFEFRKNLSDWKSENEAIETDNRRKKK